MTHICHRSNSGTLNCLCPLPFDADEENEETGPTGNMRTFASTREFALKNANAIESTHAVGTDWS